MTLCSGTTMGTPAALCCYLERVLTLMRQADRQDLRAGDQALHNAVAYEGLAGIPYSVRYSANGVEQVYTLTVYLAKQEIRRGPAGSVVTPSGQPVPIVHQYDRHPEIEQALLGSLQSRSRTGALAGPATRVTGDPERRQRSAPSACCASSAKEPSPGAAILVCRGKHPPRR